jgi:hypothetical protein
MKSGCDTIALAAVSAAIAESRTPASGARNPVISSTIGRYLALLQVKSPAFAK